MKNQMRVGDVVFAKRLKLSTLKGATEFTFKGNGCCLLLGFQNLGTPNRSVEDYRRALAEIGYIGCDDITAFLGGAAMKTLMEKFVEKYGGVAPRANAEVIETPPAAEATAETVPGLSVVENNTSPAITIPTS